MKRTAMKPRSKPMKRSPFKPGSSSTLSPVGKRGERRMTADERWRKIVRERAGGLCQWCGGEGEEGHHLYEKGTARFAHLRHDERNGCYLCKDCHRLDATCAHSDLPAFRAMASIEFRYFTPLYLEMEGKAMRPRSGGAS